MEQSLWKRRLCFYFEKSYRRSVYVLFLKKSTKKPGNRSEWFPDPPCRRKGGRIPLYEYPLVVSVRNERAVTAILLSVI